MASITPWDCIAAVGNLLELLDGDEALERLHVNTLPALGRLLEVEVSEIRKQL